MNSRRKISNVIKKEGFENMFEVLFVVNSDNRRNNACSFKNESFKVQGEELVFEPGVLKGISRILNTSQKEIISEIKSKL